MDKRKDRLTTLRTCADMLTDMIADMPAHKLRLEAATGMVRRLADAYERACNDLAELERSERKPPMRVNPRGRRKASDVRSRELCSCNDPVCTRAHIKRDLPMDNSNVADENEG